MSIFTARNRSVAVVPVGRDALWDVLSDPDLLADLTPHVESIAVDGARWRWKLAGVSALGITVAPAFTERMTFQAPSRIIFAHEPPPGRKERAGADGVYELATVAPDRTRLMIDLTMCVDLPLPPLVRRAVEKIMATTMQRAGDSFAEKLYAHLGIGAGEVGIEQGNGAEAR